MANSQHRCVFVGNIPYDATEEQLIQICEEVGPVVSFRLVIDRETGKPKGYGFCEYKDEETALSARRNLQGYEINGRQLRVDFAENDKNNDRTRDQGRGGPGMAANTDTQKQYGGPAVHGDSGLHQPVGLQVAMEAAATMARALGGAQTAISNFSENGLQSHQPVLGTDPLTLQLAKMSRNQLTEILSEIKVMAMQNKELARQLLLATPQLPKAIFQVQIILGVVSPQMQLQMPNIRQASGPLTQPFLQDGQPGQQPAVQTFPGLPPQNKVHFGLPPQPQQAQVPAGHLNSLVHNQYAPSQFPAQPRFQNLILQQGALPGQSGVSVRPPLHSQQLASVSVGPPVQQVQPPMIQQPSQVGSSNLGQKSESQMIGPNATVQPPLLIRPPLMDHGFQSTSIMSGFPNNMNKNSDRFPQVTSNDPAWTRTSQSLPSGLSKKESMSRENLDPINQPSKMVKLDDGGRGTPFLEGNARPSTSAPVSSQAFGMSGNQIPKAEAASNSEKQVSQLPPDVENALLQQVLNLTPEQLSSLPPDQQQQVIQLQQMLRQPS
ncbi:hypothetical protein LguiB_010172 [Lonicera macranthoides]